MKEIALYTAPTPNGHKVSIALEELGLPYAIHPVDIGKGEQFLPEFLALSPNNKIPAIVDPDGPGGAPLALAESGAILIYLAEKAGRLWPTEPAARYHALQWMMFQMAHVGPMLGQAHHFRQYAPEKLPYAIDRYTKEAGRLYGVLDKRLGAAPYLAGEYSMVDIATFPWLRGYERQGQSLDDFPNVKRWMEAIGARPAVQRGLLAPPPRATQGFDEKAKSVLFGSEQFAKR